MSYKPDDLVWAKMKGYAPWPARIAVPTNNKRSKDKYWCFFFGTNNFAWIETSQIKPFMKYKDVLKNGSKSQAFKKALEDIEEYVKTSDLGDYLNTEDDYELDPPVTSTPLIESTSKKRKQSQGNRSTISPPAKRIRVDVSDSLVENGSAIDDSSFSKDTTLEEPSESTLTQPTITDHASTFSKRLGFLGLGNIGSAIVKDLLNAGYILNVWNRTKKKCEDMMSYAESHNRNLQLTVCSTPLDVFLNSDIIFSCLNEEKTVNKIIEEVFKEPLDLSDKGYVEMTSLHPETAADMFLKFKVKGCKYMEAQIQSKKLFLCSGDKKLFDECGACLMQANARLIFCNEGIKTNLLLQLIKGVSLAGLAEAFALAEHCGLSEKDLLTIFSHMEFCNAFLLEKARLIVNRSFKEKIQHSVALMQKDMDLIMRIADDLKQPTMMVSKANELYKQARNYGNENEVDAAVVYLRKKKYHTK